MHVAEFIRKLLCSSPRTRQRVPLGDGAIPHGRILAAAVLVLLAAYGASYYLSSGGRIRPERVSLVPKSLLQPLPEAQHLKFAHSDPPTLVEPASILWPHPKGPGPYGL